MRAVYRLFEKDASGAVCGLDGIFSRAVAMRLAQAHRKSGRRVYARRVDIALTRPATTNHQERHGR